ncbi:uncharacterized protein N7496_010757 [Penicillium cataractarum]|uniref:Uncharacterized protein n=1 Tax=Penicillium cataractarum TaxID=2100454 RepID=A0A9W9UVQ8_9EURO|nr:uncharacterized protein N7496_010757 [Penicillium cataractarum]KAJ5358344.1 hypothetical protein N7496_010757 [Penicillium cataractarum]
MLTPINKIKSSAILIVNPFKKLSLYTKIVFLILKAYKSLKFNLEEKESYRLEKFFSREEIKVVKEEKDERIDEIEVELISNTKELNNKLNNKIVAEIPNLNYA